MKGSPTKKMLFFLLKRVKKTTKREKSWITKGFTVRNETLKSPKTGEVLGQTLVKIGSN